MKGKKREREIIRIIERVREIEVIGNEMKMLIIIRKKERENESIERMLEKMNKGMKVVERRIQEKEYEKGEEKKIED